MTAAPIVRTLIAQANDQRPSAIAIREGDICVADHAFRLVERDYGVIHFHMLLVYGRG